MELTSIKLNALNLGFNQLENRDEKQIQEEIDKTQFKIKVIEKSGKKLIRQVQRNDPFRRKNAEIRRNV